MRKSTPAPKKKMLEEYRRKRDFDVTPEPSGRPNSRNGPKAKLLYVIQKHQASHLHYDFRLEWRGVLLSWAIPKGPSLDPSVKRLAVQVEDHPIEYGSFEGVIPEGEYGAGTVMVWDKGMWLPEVSDVDAALAKGELKFQLFGNKLRGSWVLVRTRLNRSGKSQWLLIKHRDEYATSEDVEAAMPQSAASRRLMADIARAGRGDVTKAAKADPAGTPAR